VQRREASWRGGSGSVLGRKSGRRAGPGGPRGPGWHVGPARWKGGLDGLWAGELENKMKSQSEIDF
jgi:hypothetical protein